MECLKLDMRLVVRNKYASILLDLRSVGLAELHFSARSSFSRPRPRRPIAHAVSANRVCRHNRKRRALDARLPANEKHSQKYRKTLVRRHITGGFSVSRGSLKDK